MFGRDKTKKPDPIDRSRSLDAIPVLNPSAKLDESDPDAIRVTVRFGRGSGFLARFQPAVMERSVKLDELGSFVLKLIDGRHTTREIIDAFRQRFKVNRREAELSCVTFIKSLASRHVVSVIVK